MKAGDWVVVVDDTSSSRGLVNGNIHKVCEFDGELVSVIHGVGWHKHRFKPIEKHDRIRFPRTKMVRQRIFHT